MAEIKAMADAAEVTKSAGYAGYAGSALSQIQAPFDSLHPLHKTVVSRVLVDHITIKGWSYRAEDLQQPLPS